MFCAGKRLVRLLCQASIPPLHPWVPVGTAQASSVMQELYKLDISSRAMTHVLGTEVISCNISFAPDSNLCLVLLPAEAMLEVYSQSGQRLARFPERRVPGDSSLPSLAFLVEDHVAMAHTQSFIVHDLRSGQLLATIWPAQDSADCASMTRAGVIAADRAGSTLAFCAAGTSVLHLYDAATLNLLGCVCASGDVVPAASGGYHRTADLVWGVHGWLLVTASVNVMGHVCEDLHLLSYQDGSNTYEEVLWRGHQPEGRSASPDGALVCCYDLAASTVEILDARFGLPLSKHAVPALPNMPEEEDVILLVDMWWSSCSSRSSRILVRVFGFTEARDWTEEQMLVLRLQAGS